MVRILSRPTRGEALLLTGYAIGYAAMMPHAVFSRDDAHWLGMVQWITAGDPERLWGLLSPASAASHGAHSGLAAYLHALFYLIHPSAFTVLAAVAASLLFTHWLWMRVGRVLGVPSLGYLLSVLYFALPSLFAYYGLRVWQVAYLPPCLAWFLFFSLRYVQSFHRGDWIRLCLGLGVGAHFHPTALLLFPAAVLAYVFWDPDRSLRHYGAGATALLIPLVPFLTAAGKTEPWGTGAVLLLVSLPPFLKGLRLRETWCWGATLGAAGIAFSFPSGRRPLGQLADLLAAPNPWLSQFLGASASPWNLSPLWSVALMLWAVSFVHRSSVYTKLERGDRFVLWGNLLPLLLTAFAALWVRTYHHYLLFLVPFPLLLMSQYLRGRGPGGLPGPSVARHLAAGCLVLGYSAMSYSLGRAAAVTGGEGARCSTLAAKYHTLHSLREETSLRLLFPERFLENWTNRCLWRDTWQPLVREVWGKSAWKVLHRPDAARPVYLSEPRSPAYREKRLEATLGSRIRRKVSRGPVNLYYLSASDRASGTETELIEVN